MQGGLLMRVSYIYSDSANALVGLLPWNLYARMLARRNVMNRLDADLVS
jgi:hypothetical protein